MLDKNQPIVVKKIKKSGHGHHGGAWKIAYADFVTAMMAFFLLMWLLAMTTPEQKRAISEFFQQPTAITGGKEGANSSVISIGSTIKFETVGLGQNPNPTYQGPRSEFAAPTDEEVQKRAEALEQKKLSELMDQIKEAIEKNQNLQPYKDQLIIEMTEDGLRIQVVDKQNRPMFAIGSAQVQWYMKGILKELAKFINTVPNNISIAGHTDARKYSAEASYTNWELSADRANASRRELLSGGMKEEKISRVVGLASKVLHDSEDPYNPINRRISITVLKKSAEQAMLRESGFVTQNDLPTFVDLPKITSDQIQAPVLRAP